MIRARTTSPTDTKRRNPTRDPLSLEVDNLNNLDKASRKSASNQGFRAAGTLSTKADRGQGPTQLRAEQQDPRQQHDQQAQGVPASSRRRPLSPTRGGTRSSAADRTVCVSCSTVCNGTCTATSAPGRDEGREDGKGGAAATAPRLPRPPAQNAENSASSPSTPSPPVKTAGVYFGGRNKCTLHASASAATIAISYARELHFACFPVAYKSKHPLAGSRAHLDATTDPDELRRAFARRSRLNVAMCPAASGLVVIDVDVRARGDETIAELQRKHGAFPETVRALTASGDGSCHYYFRAPKGVRFPSSLGPGVDVKHEGYTLLPPSVGPNGRRYGWDAGGHPSEVAFADCPAWIVKLAKTKSARPAATPATGPAASSFFGVAFAAASMVIGEARNGALLVRCPWAAEHTGGRDGDGSSVVLPPTGEDRWGLYHCSHGHCSGRRTIDLLSALPYAALAEARRQHRGGLVRAVVIGAWLQRLQSWCTEGTYDCWALHFRAVGAPKYALPIKWHVYPSSQAHRAIGAPSKPEDIIGREVNVVVRGLPSTKLEVTRIWLSSTSL